MAARLIALVVAAMIVLAVPAAAADGRVNERDRFQLWADCRAVGLEIDPLRGGHPHFQLTLHAVEIAARSRLRAAGLYNATKYVGLLIVFINMVRVDWLFNEAGKQPFSIAIRYYKLMKDIMSGESNLAVAWHAGSVGLGDPAFVLSAVSRKVDEFIDEYLRVNRDACEKRPTAR